MENDNLNLLSIGQAADYLGVSIDTLRRWEKKGKIVSYRSPGGHRYFKKDELDNMFGKKYERAEETKPRKVYETVREETNLKDTEPTQISQIEPISQIETESEEVQDDINELLSEDKKTEGAVEDFFARQPKNIEIPRLNPIIVKEQTAVEEPKPQVQQEQYVQPPQSNAHLFSSFSQLDAATAKPAKKEEKMPIQVVLLIIAAVVITIAMLAGIVYFTTQTNMVSPM